MVEKNGSDTIQKIIDAEIKNEMFIYNVFRITKNSTTNFEIDRQ